MAIRKYGLDEAEIEHLRAANCTDEEINDLNRKRVQEQMEEDNPTGGKEGDEEVSRLFPHHPHIPLAAEDFIARSVNPEKVADIVEKFMVAHANDVVKEHPEIFNDPDIIIPTKDDVPPADASLTQEERADLSKAFQAGGLLGDFILNNILSPADAFLADNLRRIIVPIPTL